MVQHILKNKKTTYDTALTKLCKQLFGDLYQGTFSWDVMPQLKNNESCIMNVDNHTEPGTHWIGIYFNNNEYYMYDSFGRNLSNLIKGLPMKPITEKPADIEQNIFESNCGQRCIAWLVCVYEYGIDEALLI